MVLPLSRDARLSQVTRSSRLDWLKGRVQNATIGDGAAESDITYL
jgi:hypothetical protein